MEAELSKKKKKMKKYLKKENQIFYLKLIDIKMILKELVPMFKKP